jgi:hypothetical protein
VKIRTLCAIVATAFIVSGCTSGMSAAVQAVQNAFQADTGVDNVPLNPQFRYLRVTVGGRAALLVLGYVDKDDNGPIEVYYSAQRETLRLQNGRIVGAVGVTTEWRNVRLPELPPWLEIASGKRPLEWVRVRDVMPGYRYGVRDQLVLRPINPPNKSELRSVNPAGLTWFEETVQAESAGGYFPALFGESPSTGILPAARYAVALDGNSATVVYGEQCLAANLCITWQRWPQKP